VRFAAVPDRVSPMTAAEARKVVPASATPAPAPNPTSDTPTPSATPTLGNATASSPSSEASKSPGSDLWTPVPDGRGGTALLRTVETEGGSARLRFSEDEVTVLATTPNDGYTGTFNQQSPTVVTVTFESSDHRSRLTAFWDRVAKVQVSEEPVAA